MNLDQLKKCVGFRVRLEPLVVRLDSRGRELPSRDEVWIIQAVSETEVRLDEETMLPLTTKLGKDYIHHFTSDPNRSVAGGVQYGFLTLSMQMFIQNDKVTYRPCPRPGQRTDPPRNPIAERQVDFNYPSTSGIDARLAAAGYRTRWARRSRVAQLELEGWEVVVENDAHGMPTSFYIRDNPEDSVYIKTREPDLQKLAESPFWRGQAGLESCTVSSDRRGLVFKFADPTSLVAFQMRMKGRTQGIRYERAPGSLDTLLGFVNR